MAAIFEPGRNVTFTYEAAATAGSPLKLGAGDYTVTPATAATDLVIGQADQDVAAGAVAHAAIIGDGIREFATDAVIAVGAFVAPAAGGKVVAATKVPTIGVVVKASTSTEKTVHVIMSVPIPSGE